MSGKATPIPCVLKWTAVLLLTCSVACGTAPKKGLPKGQTIVLSDSILAVGGTDTVRFGRLTSGEIAVRQLLLRNDSPKPVVIVSDERTCGCITLEYDSQPIMSDSLRPVRLIFDSRGLYGWQFKLVKIRFAGSPAPFKLYVDVEVE